MNEYPAACSLLEASCPSLLQLIPHMPVSGRTHATSPDGRSSYFSAHCHCPITHVPYLCSTCCLM